MAKCNCPHKGEGSFAGHQCSVLTGGRKADPSSYSLTETRFKSPKLDSSSPFLLPLDFQSQAVPQLALRQTVLN